VCPPKIEHRFVIALPVKLSKNQTASPCIYKSMYFKILDLKTESLFLPLAIKTENYLASFEKDERLKNANLLTNF
jgi:hypothetical protein